MDDFANIFAYEIKEDLAKRYFGCRKKLENDSSFYLKSLVKSAEEKKIGIHDVLIRIYCFLKIDELCCTFLHFTHLPEEFSRTALIPGKILNINDLPTEKPQGGFTKKQRYKNILFHLYFLLEESIADYCYRFAELEKLHNDLCSEIKKFERNFDLQSILQFLREIDDPDRGKALILNNQPNNLKNYHKANDMTITAPHPPSTIMTPIKRIKPLQAAKDQRVILAHQGFSAER